LLGVQAEIKANRPINTTVAHLIRRIFISIAKLPFNHNKKPRIEDYSGLLVEYFRLVNTQ
jgi:hypothetical protein